MYSVVVLGCDNDLKLSARLDDQFEALATTSGEECLQAVGAGTYKAVLIDITCTSADAFATCRSIRDSSDIPVILVTGAVSHDERLQTYDCGADDFLSADELERELHGRLERIIINRIANDQLKRQLAQANEMAFIAMSDTSDLGVNIQFLLEINQCSNLDELGMRLFQSLQNYGLHCSLQMRSQYGTKNMEANGLTKDLESKLLMEMKDEGRYVDFGRRSVMNYEAVSLLVKNMPVDDEKKYGAIKDNVFSLLQGANARLRALDNLESLALEKELVSKMAEQMRELMSTVDNSYQDVMRNIADVVEDMADGVDRSIQFLGMDENQERSLQDTMEQGIVNTNRIFNEGLKVDENLKHFLQELDDVFNSETVDPGQLKALISHMEQHTSGA